jgi:hypothetical protein
VEIQIKRRGGLAGVTLRGEFSTTDLDSATAALVEKGIDRLFETKVTASPPRPDMFEYEISVPERGSVSVAEHDLPVELRPLVEMLPNAGTIEGAQKRTA